MKKSVFIEGIFLLAFSLFGIAEGLRLVFERDPTVVYDMLGPGYYIVFLSVGLMAVGIAHLATNYRKAHEIQKDTMDKEMRTRLIGTVLAMVIYILFINYLGYIVASIVFFLTEFRIVGIKSWRINCILTICLTAVYYVVFVHYCDMIFPRGILF
jgi:drug/metabolite transporter (DMT)-like permease